MSRTPGTPGTTPLLSASARYSRLREAYPPGDIRVLAAREAYIAALAERQISTVIDICGGITDEQRERIEETIRRGVEANANPVEAGMT